MRVAGGAGLQEEEKLRRLLFEERERKREEAERLEREREEREEREVGCCMNRSFEFDAHVVFRRGRGRRQKDWNKLGWIAWR